MLQYTPRATTRFPPLLIFLILSCFPAHAKRHDIIVMKNGDRITGEVKRLEQGVLYIEPEYVSTAFGVNWFEVASIQSAAGYQVVLKNGDHVAGSIEKILANESSKADFKVRTEDGEVVSTPAADVVNIESKKKAFWDQLTGAIDLGYNFTSGNDQTQVSSSANAEYLSTRWNTGVSLNSSFSGQSGASKTNLWQGTTYGERFLTRNSSSITRNSSLIGLVDFLHSSQQQLNLRTTLGGGFGRYWTRTNQQQFQGIVGLVFANETFESTISNPTQKNIEGLLGLKYQLFRFSRYSLSSQLYGFPGLSDTGRVRATTKTTFSVKLVNNFHTDFSFWDNFDSHPPISSAKKNELGITNSLGWTF
jgi:Protein of unknown function, DUF481